MQRVRNDVPALPESELRRPAVFLFRWGPGQNVQEEPVYNTGVVWPDDAPILFAHAIMQGKPIRIFNHGDMQRDFTYIDDIVEGTLRVLSQPPSQTPPCTVYNIGNHQPVPLLDYVAALEAALGRKAIRELAPMQPGDVKATYADTDRLASAVDFAPKTGLADGLAKFAAWFREYYGYA